MNFQLAGIGRSSSRNHFFLLSLLQLSLMLSVSLCIDRGCRALLGFRGSGLVLAASVLLHTASIAKHPSIALDSAFTDSVGMNSMLSLVKFSLYSHKIF